MDQIKDGVMDFRKSFKGENHVGSDFEGKDLSYSFLYETNFTGANLAGANLQNSMLHETNFTGAKLTNADLSKLSNGSSSSLFVGATMISVKAIASTFSGQFVGADMSMTNFSKSDLRGSNFRGADFYGANLSECNFIFCNFQGSNLSHSNLSDTDLSNSYLRGATCMYTLFCGANLSEADMSNSWFPGADFTGAKMPDGKIHKCRKNSNFICCIGKFEI